MPKERAEKEEKTIPDWILVNIPVFKKIYDTVNESVRNKLSTRAENKYIKMDPVQHFLQNIVNGEFDNREDAVDWYVKNIYYNYEETLRGVNSQNAKKNDKFL